MDDRFYPVQVQFGEGSLDDLPDHSAANTLVPVVLFANNNTNFAGVILAVNVFDCAVSNELVISQNTKQTVCLSREVVAVPCADFSKCGIPVSQVSVHLIITPPCGNGRKLILWKRRKGYVHGVFPSLFNLRSLHSSDWQCPRFISTRTGQDRRFASYTMRTARPSLSPTSLYLYVRDF